MTRVNRDLIVAILLVVVCGVFLAASFEIREPNYGQLSPAAWPRAVIGALSVLTLIYLMQSARKGLYLDGPEEEPGDEPRGRQKGWRNVFVCFALFLAYLLSMPWLGMLVGGTLFVFMLLNALGGWSPRMLALHAAVAVVSMGGMWSIFTFALGVILPRGDLFGTF